MIRVEFVLVDPDNGEPYHVGLRVAAVPRRGDLVIVPVAYGQETLKVEDVVWDLQTAEILVCLAPEGFAQPQAFAAILKGLERIAQRDGF